MLSCKLSTYYYIIISNRSYYNNNGLASLSLQKKNQTEHSQSPTNAMNYLNNHWTDMTSRIHTKDPWMGRDKEIISKQLPLIHRITWEIVSR